MRDRPRREKVFTVTRSQFHVETYRGSGPGGQHRNKTESCVKLTHIPSGATESECSDRSQHTNKRTALERMRKNPAFVFWCQQQARSILQKRASAEQVVDVLMDPKNIVAEIQQDGKWVPWENAEAT